MSELFVLTRRRVLGLLAAGAMSGSTRTWSGDEDADEGDSEGSGDGGDDDSSDPADDTSGPGGGDDGDADDGGNGSGDDGRLSDHEYARRGVALGEIVPLASILRTVRAVKPGRVVDVDLVRAAGKRAVYRILVIGQGNELWQVTVDAGRNTVLRVRRH